MTKIKNNSRWRVHRGSSTKSGQKGYIISIVTFFVLIIMLSMALSMSFLIAERQKNITNTVKSSQSYYAAESGIEDALLRLKRTPQMLVLSYNVNVNNIIASVVIPNMIGGIRSITSQASNNAIDRKVRVTYSIGGAGVSFYYGVEVGEGGLSMGNNSEIIGNVFSSGNITGSGTINNNVVVSGNGHSVQGVTVEGNVLAYSCLSEAEVKGNLTYVTGGSHTCTVRGTTSSQAQEISEQPMPIPQSQIDEWKSEAVATEIFSGSKTISDNQSLGPIKITGNLTISNGVTLTLTGIVYVVGNISIDNNADIKLDSSYGSLGGVLLSDGTIHPSNNNKFLGSGQVGSYLLVLSTNTSDNAIYLDNNVSGGVFYTSAGGLHISNNVSVMEATGYKVIMENNSTIEYSSGIVNIYFASGPSGGGEVTSWEEY